MPSFLPFQKIKCILIKLISPTTALFLCINHLLKRSLGYTVSNFPILSSTHTGMLSLHGSSKTTLPRSLMFSVLLKPMVKSQTLCYLTYHLTQLITQSLIHLFLLVFRSPYCPPPSQIPVLFPPFLSLLTVEYPRTQPLVFFSSTVTTSFSFMALKCHLFTISS